MRPTPSQIQDWDHEAETGIDAPITLEIRDDRTTHTTITAPSVAEAIAAACSLVATAYIADDRSYRERALAAALERALAEIDDAFIK